MKLNNKLHSWKALGLKRNFYYINKVSKKLVMIVGVRRLGIKILPIGEEFCHWAEAYKFSQEFVEYNP